MEIQGWINGGLAAATVGALLTLVLMIFRFYREAPWNYGWRETSKFIFGIILVAGGCVVGFTYNLLYLMGYSPVPFLHTWYAIPVFLAIVLGYLLHIRTVTVNLYGLWFTLTAGALMACVWSYVALVSF